MYKYFSLLVVFLLCGYAVASSDTNVMMYVRMQWSTNGSDWNEDQAEFDDTDEFPVWGLDTNCFLVSEITNYYGSAGPYEPIGLGNYWGGTPVGMTNHLLYSTFYVVPSSNDVPGILYRPYLSITNYFHLTNVGSGVVDTNPPGNP